MRGTLLFFVFILGCHCTLISISDTLWYFTEYNWHIENDDFAEAVNPGSYFKLTVNETKKIELLLDFTGIMQPTQNLVSVEWSINGGASRNATLPTSKSPLVLHDGQQKGLFTVFFWINSRNAFDSWTPYEFVRVTGLQVDDGAKLVQTNLRPLRLLHYGDSISEGWNNLYAPGAGPLFAPLDHQAHFESLFFYEERRIYWDSAVDSWVWHLAAALNAELSMVAWAGQGYTKGGNGNTPLLWTKNGDSSNNGWTWINSKYPRSFEECPQIVTNNHGTNDLWNASVVPERIAGWLADFNKVCPSTTIIMVPPFGGFLINEINKGVTMYKKMSTKPVDNVHILELTDVAKEGIAFSGRSLYSWDGLHPNVNKDAQLGAIVAMAIGSSGILKK